MQFTRTPIRADAVSETRSFISNLALGAINDSLRGASPDEIVRWGLGLQRRAIITTSMGVNAAATLHVVTCQAPNTPVIWIDSGFNLRDTYVAAEKITEKLGLNLHVYSPKMTAERISAKLGGIPTPDEEAKHSWFSEQVKLEPFRRAVAEWRPEVWFTGIRKDETEHRQQLDSVSVDARGILKIAPFFHSSAADIEAYMARHQLPTCKHYFDPTKVEEGRECGLHTGT